MLKKNILFSIVIPTYNRAEFILKTVNSVLQQSYELFEIIIVDDGSTDNTEEQVKTIKDARVFYFKKKNGERGAARNFGALKSKGDYINFFDSDDLLYEHHLLTAHNLLNSKEYPEIFHLSYDKKDINGMMLEEVYPPSDINEALVNGNCLSCNGVFIRRDIALKNPFFEDRRMAALEDYALWLHLASQYPILSSPVITSTVIEHEDRSVVSSDPTKLITRQEIFLEYIFNNNLILARYNARLNLIQSNIFSYISLHIALTKKEKKASIKYLYKSLIANPRSFFTRRTLAILKHLIV